MMETHFPRSEVLNEEDIPQRPLPGFVVQGTKAWALAGWIVSYNKVRWAIFNVNAYK